ncbi:hypothetical protein [Mesorhizobium sp. LNJC405B00]|uniref:hypothetical protein n=1 Tax=Mesorhizobium sp. LNJC405B00 TaxID=1287281 RepID=UPI0003CEC272|nr:hypothetical protein [Mesorhizobium sp. LNJC405B00]ESX98701.1 hypothetical protein X755_15190 [Mesorhizobium sp. LNJC405B00]
MLWVLKNWKLVILIVSLLALSITGVALYQKGKSEARQEAAIISLKEDLAASERARELADAALKADQQKAAQDAIAYTELSKRKAALNDYADSLADGLHQCLSGADVDRLRDLWK